MVGAGQLPSFDIDPTVWNEIRMRRFYTEAELLALVPNGCVPDGETLYKWEG